jgi:hypothetical protein
MLMHDCVQKQRCEQHRLLVVEGCMLAHPLPLVVSIALCHLATHPLQLAWQVVRLVCVKKGLGQKLCFCEPVVCVLDSMMPHLADPSFAALSDVRSTNHLFCRRCGTDHGGQAGTSPLAACITVAASTQRL